MIKSLLTQPNRNRTFIFLAIGGLSVIAAVTVGIDDNPPGILLAFLSTTASILAFVHPWRTSRQFRLLLYASALGFVVFGFLHNLLEGFASILGSSGLVHDFLNLIAVAFFLIAILVCPPGLLVGAVGAVVMSIRNRHRPPHPMRYIFNGK